MQDPTTKSPKPPFKQQQQPWPGLASKRDPVPDHGEESYKGSGPLDGRKALITGGTPVWVGRQLSRTRGKVLMSLLTTFLQKKRMLGKLLFLFRNLNATVALPGDLRDEKFCQKLVEDAVAKLGGLDVLVNNAARQQTKPTLEDISYEDFDATMKTNVYAAFLLTKDALKHLKPGSLIIHSTPVQAHDPSEDLVDYAMTKAAVMNFTKSMARQLGPKGIRVNGVAPGPIWNRVSGGATMEKLTNIAVRNCGVAFGSTRSNWNCEVEIVHRRGRD